MNSSFSLDKLVRENIRNLKPYSSARNEYTGANAVFLDANENPHETGFNRYPDPLQWELKKRIAEIKQVDENYIFLGNGSDEAIDILFRIFCKPAVDNILSIEPSYGMYRVCADINDVKINNVLLTKDFQLDNEAIYKAIDAHTKLLFLCSPNNPSGNLLNETDIIDLLNNFNGIVIVDEAYIDFSGITGLLPKIKQYKNLVVLQTFSKAWGLAGMRLGMAFADPAIVRLMNKVKYPYNVNVLTQKEVFQKLANTKRVSLWVEELIDQREKLKAELIPIPEIEKVFDSHANFLLVKCRETRPLYDYLIERKMIVRDRSSQPLCEGCLRMTIGTENDNSLLVKYIKEFYNKQ